MSGTKRRENASRREIFRGKRRFLNARYSNNGKIDENDVVLRKKARKDVGKNGRRFERLENFFGEKKEIFLLKMRFRPLRVFDVVVKWFQTLNRRGRAFPGVVFLSGATPSRGAIVRKDGWSRRQFAETLRTSVSKAAARADFASAFRSASASIGYERRVSRGV